MTDEAVLGQLELAAAWWVLKKLVKLDQALKVYEAETEKDFAAIALQALKDGCPVLHSCFQEGDEERDR